MKCIRCGKNVRTSVEERNFFRGMGYYTPMYWVRDQGLNETICKAEGLDPNDSEHFLCFDCYYDLMEKQREEYLKNKDFGPIKIKGTFKESKVTKKLNEMGRTVFNYNASIGWSVSNKTYAWHYFRNFLEDIGATRTRDDGVKGCSGELKGLSFELNYAFSNKEYNYTIDVFNIAQGTIQDQWQGRTLGEFKEDFQEMKDIYTSSEAGIYPEETLTEARQYQGNEKIKFTTYLKYLKKEEHLTDDIIETFKQYLADEQNFYEEDYDEKRTFLEWDDFLTLFENTGWDEDEE